MATIVFDPVLEKKLRDERARTGADRFDEVWDGTYMMAPLPNNEQQRIVGRLTAVFQQVIGWSGTGDVLPGANVSDRVDG